MRSNCALYIDAGYLLASAATRVTRTSLRNGIHVEYKKLIEAIVAQAETMSGLGLLRVHWYDSAHNGVPDPQQERIGELSKVKLRLGRFGVDGQQKGVDLRIGLDLVAHALGVQVVVLAVPTSEGKPHGVSRHLIRAADELAMIAPEVIDRAVIKVEIPTQPKPVPKPPRLPVSAGRSPLDVGVTAKAPAAPPASQLAYRGMTGATSEILPGYQNPDDHAVEINDVVRNVIGSFRKSATPGELAATAKGKPSIPRDIDRALLIDLSDALGVYDLSDAMRVRLRDHFWIVFDETN